MTSRKCSPSLIPWGALEGMSYLSARQLDAHNPGTTIMGYRTTWEGCVSSQALLALQIAKATLSSTRTRSKEAGRWQPLEVIHKEGGWAERTYRNDLKGLEP